MKHVLSAAFVVGMGLAAPAAADLAFFEERCVVPFASQAENLPTGGLEEINMQGALFYQDAAGSAVLSGDLGRDWLRACNVAWPVQGEAMSLIAEWQALMEARGLTAPPECIKRVGDSLRIYAASDSRSEGGYFALGQLEVSQGETKAWAQISEQDGPYPLHLECR